MPRDYKIEHSIHAGLRGGSTRQIPEEMIEKTIREGSVYDHKSIGKRGGIILEFAKTFVLRNERGAPRSKRVVAICEVKDKLCRVITVYNE
jgi:hypothetical protein